MLENEEDDDYFTPLPNTSLSNIFKKPSEKTENESLKYSPPAPKQAQKKENTLTKGAAQRVVTAGTAENIFSCVFDAYQWNDNIYTHKGKLGCTILKRTIDGNNISHIILYDSKKNTLSSTIATKELEVSVKEQSFISYYDQLRRYWCLYGSATDLQKIVEVLTSLDVSVKVLKESESNINEIAGAVTKNNSKLTTELDQSIMEVDVSKTNNVSNKNIDSDTDSSINRKTKASILNRMANMGQSMLPPRDVSIEHSDSSDTNESDNQIVAFIPKKTKNIKKNITEKNIFDHQRKTDAIKKAIVPVNRIQHSVERENSLGIDDQCISVQNCSIIPSSSGSDLNLFITEQRVSNSEFRINIARVTDKLDHILDKINNLDTKDKNEGSANINTDIFQKLLKEYESKIKTYEELLKKADSKANILESKDEMLNELIILRNKVEQLDKCLNQKDNQISALTNEIKCLKEDRHSENSIDYQDEHHKKILQLEQELLSTNEMLQNLKIKNDQLLKTDDEIANKIKIIMNDTFQAAAANFDNNESYTGDTIKNIIASVIKKVTKEALNKS